MTILNLLATTFSLHAEKKVNTRAGIYLNNKKKALAYFKFLKENFSRDGN